VLVTTYNMTEAEQCERLAVMTHALDEAGFAVQSHGQALRVSGTAGAVTAVLSGAGIDAAVQTVPADLEEAFVAMVTRAPSA
jgi:hypothetical protein